jgi:hypothetical protein
MMQLPPLQPQWPLPLLLHPLAAARAVAAGAVPVQTRAARRHNPPLPPLPPVSLKLITAAAKTVVQSNISTLAWTAVPQMTVVLVRAARATASSGTKRARNYFVSVDSRTMQRDS